MTLAFSRMRALILFPELCTRWRSLACWQTYRFKGNQWKDLLPLDDTAAMAEHNQSSLSEMELMEESQS